MFVCVCVKVHLVTSPGNELCGGGFASEHGAGVGVLGPCISDESNFLSPFLLSHILTIFSFSRFPFTYVYTQQYTLDCIYAPNNDWTELFDDIFHDLNPRSALLDSILITLYLSIMS